MRSQIDAARIVTKEMKAQMRKDARMAKRKERSEAKVAEQSAAPVEPTENNADDNDQANTDEEK